MQATDIILDASWRDEDGRKYLEENGMALAAEYGTPAVIRKLSDNGIAVINPQIFNNFGLEENIPEGNIEELTRLGAKLNLRDIYERGMGQRRVSPFLFKIATLLVRNQKAVINGHTVLADPVTLQILFATQACLDRVTAGCRHALQPLPEMQAVIDRYLQDAAAACEKSQARIFDANGKQVEALPFFRELTGLDGKVARIVVNTAQKIEQDADLASDAPRPPVETVLKGHQVVAKNEAVLDRLKQLQQGVAELMEPYALSDPEEDPLPPQVEARLAEFARCADELTENRLMAVYKNALAVDKFPLLFQRFNRAAGEPVMMVAGPGGGEDYKAYLTGVKTVQEATDKILPRRIAAKTSEPA